MTFIIGCKNAAKLSEKVAKQLDVPLAKTDVKKFPDGELYVRIDENLEDEDIIVIQSGYPNQNEALIELFLTLDAIKDMDPKKVSLMMAYLPYSKQDKRFKDGEAVSAGTILKIIKSFKINKIYAVNLHFAKEENEFDFFNVDIKNINAAPSVVKHVQDKYGDFITVLPGKGSSHLLDEGERVFVETRRNEYKSTEDKYFGEAGVIEKELSDVNGRTVLILDDMINTGGTIVKTCELVKSNGANKVIVGCIHGLFVGNAMEKLKQLDVDEIISTDTIESKFSTVSVAPLLAEEIRKL